MDTSHILEQLGFEDRAKPVSLTSPNLSDSESITLNEIIEKEFGIDAVYFNYDETGNSYPAVFLKKVDSFEEEILPEIADMHQKIWNYKKVLFLYVYTDTEIRIYNCSEKPLIKTKAGVDYNKELKNIEIKTYLLSDIEHLKELNKLFSRIAIDSGIIWTLAEAQFIRDKINLQRRVDKYLVESLIKITQQLELQGLNIEFIHKIILRSLFLLYLEDRKATDEELYAQSKKGAKSYFDILEDVEATHDLYKKLDEYFNGNVFSIENEENISVEQLRLVKKCFISGYDNSSQVELFPEWRLFNFSIIQIELLSEIYEEFLSKTDPVLKKRTGAFYTPPALVEFILNEKLPINKKEENYNVKVLDPSCGSGIFLVESFKRLVKRYENAHKEKLTDFDRLTKLLTDNIFGIELHPQAIKVAAFSLYLALVDHLEPKTLWHKGKHRLPFLINNPKDKSLKEQGKNLFCRDTISDISEITELQNFNLVIGNPPFGTKGLPESVRDYCKKFGFAKEMVLPFLHKATTFAPNGGVALICNTKILTNTLSTYQEFRKWLYRDCYVEKVFNFSILRKAKGPFGGQLFGNATGPISILFYQKEPPPEQSDKIVYYAPKTYIKSNVIEGLSIDFTDLKYLPREECAKPDTKIWKIAAWGDMNDWELIRKLNKNYPTVKSFFEKENIDYGVGFEISDPANKPNSEIKKMPIHTPENIVRYYSPIPTDRIEAEKFRRLGKEEAYQTPHIIINEGIRVDNDQLILLASFVDYKSAYTKGIIGVYSKNNDADLLKLLTLYFNSDFVRYFSFLTTSSWGVERDVVKCNELFEVPFLLDKLNENQKREFVSTFNAEFMDRKLFQQHKEEVVSELNRYILNCLSENDRYFIQHLLEHIDLFHKKEKSKALYPVLEKQIKEYSEIICKELNGFLDGQDLFVNATVYDHINRFTPLMMIKLTHNETKNECITPSNEKIDDELKKLDQYLWKKQSDNIYFRKKLNYYDGDDIYIIRPNQRRFWSKARAIDDASELILEILTEEEDEG